MSRWERIAYTALSTACSVVTLIAVELGSISAALLCLSAGICFAGMLFYDDYQRWRDGR